jgi:putative Ca2+/H+ antiporter (TMEM165/GDT1 family)
MPTVTPTSRHALLAFFVTTVLWPRWATKTQIAIVMLAARHAIIAVVRHVSMMLATPGLAW